MNLNLNSQRLENLKNGESVFEAILHLGGKATFSELVKRIANSVSQPEDAVQSEVKQVLRAAVLNGYLVRHGKNYLLSRSCRTMYTDSTNRKTKSSSSEKKIEDNGIASSSNFRFPIWWSRFWSRFVVVKEKNESCAAQSPEEENLNCNEPDSELPHKNVSIVDPLNELETNVLEDTPSVSLQETQENKSQVNKRRAHKRRADKPQAISTEPLEELETDGQFESILTDSQPNARSVVNPNFDYFNNELKDDNWID